MRALLISHSNGGGGAGRATQRLYEALDNNTDIELAMYADFKHGTDSRIRTADPGQRSRRIRLEEIPAWLTRNPEPRKYSPGIASAIQARDIDRGAWDVINLHWTGFGTISIRQIGNLQTPIVWTMHDMWAFTGGLTYEDDSDTAAWRSGYAGRSVWDLERWTYRRKARNWHRPMHFVSPTRWLASLAQSSPLIGSWPVEVIPNPIDLDQFTPGPQAAARRSLGIDQHRPTVTVAVGGDPSDLRKGLDQLARALHQVSAAVDDVQLVVLGSSTPPEFWKHGGWAEYWLGPVDDHTLIAGYQAADAVVVPSRQDNLPQTATEPQACGVPVVAFRVGGLDDAVADGETGVLINPGDATALASAISRLLTDTNIASGMGAAARMRATRLWSPGVIARAYAEVFARTAYR
jgi:glycosyltransferase involved in cell wall biosynthesis